MAKKKHRKKQPNRPKTTLKRDARLLKARQWLPTYQGAKIVRAYRKRFCVDVENAVRDLLEIGYEFKPGYVDNLLKSEEMRREQLRAKKEERRPEYDMLEQDDRFFYIAGYTSGGAPYGVTWEDMARERTRTFRERLPHVPALFSELDEQEKAEAIKRLEEMIDEYFCYAEYLPDDGDRDEILNGLCGELTDSLNEWPDTPYDPSDPFDREIWGEDYDDCYNDDGEDDEDAEADLSEILPIREITPDNELIAEFDRIVALFNDELKADGLELTTFADSLFVVETERLIIRRFYEFDLESLWAGIMRKTEVMYAWEAGFNKKETRKWLNHQLARYRDDGYGYFAVTLKRGGKLIGQAGLIKTEINGDEVTEIGYIFNNKYWGKGYAIEAARACVDLAFNQFGLERIYATIRPENTASVKVAERLGMRKTGQYIKVYQDKEMPHDIYMLEKSSSTSGLT